MCANTCPPTVYISACVTVYEYNSFLYLILMYLCTYTVQLYSICHCIIYNSVIFLLVYVISLQYISSLCYLHLWLCINLRLH